jgi:gamma-glutamylcyclotransferase (GGCT)/AIG2-like uncharacterized protein YtfP
MGTALFTYGSLMFPEVWEKVVAGRYARAPAVVHDHARYAVRDATYPGMVAQLKASVEGVVYFDVSEPDMAALDAFEGDAYRRIRVPAMLRSGERVEVQTYLFLDRSGLSGQAWEPVAFQMQRFLAAYCPAS